MHTSATRKFEQGRMQRVRDTIRWGIMQVLPRRTEQPIYGAFKAVLLTGNNTHKVLQTVHRNFPGCRGCWRAVGDREDIGRGKPPPGAGISGTCVFCCRGMSTMSYVILCARSPAVLRSVVAIFESDSIQVYPTRTSRKKCWHRLPV